MGRPRYRCSHAGRAARLTALAGIALASAGCAANLFRSDDPEAAIEKAVAPDNEKKTVLISDIAHPYGLDYVKVESVALVTGLDGTGEDPPQSPQRAALLDEMARRRVENPNEVLRSPDTALVLLRGYLPPGVEKGDKFDLEVQTPTRSQTTSLRGGHVLESRMTELAVLGQQIRAGHVLAVGEGPILVDPSADSEDVAAATRGRILGGGTARRSRPLGLVVSQDHQSVRTTTAVAKAISDRFQTYEGSSRVGVAEAKTEEFVELRVHPRYKDNIARFLRVVRSLPLRETASEQQERLALLRKQLLDPLTAPSAALRLEAIGGDPIIEPLLAGLAAEDAEVRFYAAESLAYLDRTESVPALRDAAAAEPAFRAYALTALSAMDDVVAYDALRDLLASPSNETRYGAFRALWAMKADDPLVRGERLGGAFSYHVLDVKGPPMVHATRSGRPELVLFGGDQRLATPLVLDAGPDILVNGLVGDRVTISRFRAGEPTLKRTVTTSLDDVVRGIVAVGGSYPDVVQALQQAKRDGALASRFAVDAIPQAGREYDLDEPADGAETDTSATNEPAAGPASESSYRVGAPLPDLFAPKK